MLLVVLGAWLFGCRVLSNSWAAGCGVGAERYRWNSELVLSEWVKLPKACAGEPRLAGKTQNEYLYPSDDPENAL